MYDMQVLCPFYVKDHMKAMLHWQMCGFISGKVELSELNLKQLIKQFISYIFTAISLIWLSNTF